MHSRPFRQGALFDGPATYRIRVTGRLDPDRCDCLGGMRVRATTAKDGAPFVVLRGELRDQAALAGVLNTIYRLKMTILSVERLSG